MTREERAKQFAPFDAMKGLKEALLDREERHSRNEKRELSEDEGEILSKALGRTENGNAVIIEYYREYHDRRRRGVISKIDKARRYLVIDDEKIWFDDIYRLKIL